MQENHISGQILFKESILLIISLSYPIIWGIVKITGGIIPEPPIVWISLSLISFISYKLFSLERLFIKRNRSYFTFFIIGLILLHLVINIRKYQFPMDYIIIYFIYILICSFAFDRKITLGIYSGLNVSSTFFMYFMNRESREAKFIFFVSIALNSILFWIQLNRTKFFSLIFTDEEFVQKALSNKKDGVIITDINEYVITLNQEAQNYLGQKLHVLLKSKLNLPVPLENKLLNTPMIIDNDKGRKLEVKYLRIKRENIPCYLIQIKDITDELKLKHDNEMLRIKYKSIIESTDDGIVSINSEGNIDFINTSALRMTGRENEDLINKKFHETFQKFRSDGGINDEEESSIIASYKEGKRFNITNEIFWKKDDTMLPVNYTVSPILSNEAIQGAVVVFKDNTLSSEKVAQFNSHIDLLHLLSLSALALLELYSEEEIYEYAAVKIKEICRTSCVLLISYSTESNIFQTRAVAGFEKHSESLFKITGRNLEGITYSLEKDSDAFRNHTQPDKEELPDGLFSLNFGRFNRKACISIEKAVSARSTFCHPLVHNELFLGNLILLNTFNAPDNTTILESFIRQTTATLYRKKHEEDSIKEYFYSSPLITYSSFLFTEMTIDGKILFVNTAMENASGYSIDESISRSFWSLYLPNIEYYKIDSILSNLQTNKITSDTSVFTGKENKSFKIAWEMIHIKEKETRDEKILFWGYEIKQLV